MEPTKPRQHYIDVYLTSLTFVLSVTGAHFAGFPVWATLMWGVLASGAVYSVTEYFGGKLHV
jgi:hypothetical protein